MKINFKYLFAFFILLITETMIALFVHDSIIRPYIGDILVVFLMYFFTRGFLRNPIKFLPIYLFLFALVIELAQYYRVIETLKLENNKVASIIIGTSFDIMDILCYLIASVILMIFGSR